MSSRTVTVLGWLDGSRDRQHDDPRGSRRHGLESHPREVRDFAGRAEIAPTCSPQLNRATSSSCAS